ncbi:GNAT family N-acetyltransferase [Streptomyces sp. NPDC059009]|uniref:GNAT family N-acetyltransferase n=1 Tax=Streptomyces sp. NPDC059009 TaxID=3346694 RepID=UPI00369345E0
MSEAGEAGEAGEVTETSDTQEPWLAAPLVTARLTLRPVEEPDVPVLMPLWTHPDVRRHLGGPVPREVIEARRARAAGAPGVFTVVRTADGAPLGLVTVRPDGHDGRTEVGYLFLPDHWGRGYAREAVAAAVDWALAEGPPAKVPGEVVAVTQAANTRSRRVLEGLGAQLTDRFVEFEAPQLMYVFREPVSPGG